VSIGFVWGAVGAGGFGAESGDIMHFDARQMANLRFADGKSIGGFNAALAKWKAMAK